MAVKPNYSGKGIVNLTSSILTSFDVSSPYDVAESDALGNLREFENIVLLIVDGLGFNYLKTEFSDSFMAKQTKDSLSSVFPPSTGSAISTYFTGLPPQQHTLIGWYVYLSEYGLVSRILPFTNCIDWNVLNTDIGYVIDVYPLFHKIESEHHVILGSHIVDSVYSRFMAGTAKRDGYEDIDGFFSCIHHAIFSSKQRKYIHAYWPEYDDISHMLGSKSVEALQHLHEFEQRLCTFVEKINGTNTKLIVTSDHGFNDVIPENVVYTKEHPEFLECLTLPVCGDTRTGFCYVRPKKVTQFERYIENNLSHACDFHLSSNLIEENWFGLFEPNPKLQSRVGDYTLLFKDGYAILNHFPGIQPPRLLGHHGGVSEDELYVPLITIDC